MNDPPNSLRDKIKAAVEAVECSHDGAQPDSCADCMADAVIRTLQEAANTKGRVRVAAYAQEQQGPPPETITDETLADQIVADYRDGVGVRPLARRYNVGRRAIERLLDERGIPRLAPTPPRGVVDADTLEQAVAAYRSGEFRSLNAAAESVGISGMTLSRHLNAIGIRDRLSGRGPSQRVPDDIIARAVEVYRAGASISAAAKQVGISGQTLGRRLDELGVPRHPRREVASKAAQGRGSSIDEELAEKIVAAYQESESMIGVAKSFRIDPNRVRDLLDERGIPRRRRPLKTEVTEELESQIIEAYRETEIIWVVAKRFRVGELKVRTVLDKHGIAHARGRRKSRGDS